MKLADWMKANGLTDTKLARKMGIRHVSTVHRWRTGVRKPDWPCLQRIMEITKGKVKPEDFF